MEVGVHGTGGSILDGCDGCGVSEHDHHGVAGAVADRDAALIVDEYPQV